MSSKRISARPKNSAPEKTSKSKLSQSNALHLGWRENSDLKEQATAHLKEIRELQAKNLQILESRLTSTPSDSGEVAVLREKLAVAERTHVSPTCVPGTVVQALTLAVRE